ncbi:MAG TPA: dolichyl-phosphate beta-glucosyltransferase [Iamia sp.]
MALTTHPRPVAVPVPHPSTGVATVDIAVPVLDEAATLEASIRRLHAYLGERFPLSWRITIVDNGSTDGTWDVAQALVAELDGVAALHLDQRGRGRALRAAWTTTGSPVVAYMDVDLSTDLDALLPLVAPLVSGHSDLAIGTRLAPTARVRRTPGREAISRTYNLFLHTTLRNGFTDAQCGFKAVRRDVAERLLPEVEDEGWFFDTELLVLAERHGLRIHEVPVDWTDDPDSRVDVVRTALDDLRGVARLAGQLLRPADGDEASPRPSARLDLAGQVVRFASIGLVSTALFAVLFLLLAEPLGPVGADVVALAVCAVANTAANRRLTFALHGRPGWARHHRAGLLAAAGPLVVTVTVLVGLGAAGVTSTVALLAAATIANATATGARFAVLHAAMADDGSHR